MSLARPLRPGALGVVVVALCTAGCGAHASVHVGATKTVDDPNTDVSNALAKVAGHNPKSVDCPDDVPAKNGHRFRCVVTDTDGTRIGATVTETAVQGSKVSMHVKVDDHPLPK